MAEIKAIGNLAADAQLRYTPSGSPVLNFRMGDSKSKKNGDQWETVAQNWFNVTVWGSLAEHLGDKLSKGVRVEIVGEFYQREYDSRDGGKRISLDVNAWGVRVITLHKDRSAGATDPAPHQSGAYGVPQSNQPPQGGAWGAQSAQGNAGGWGTPPQGQQPPQQQQPPQSGGGWDAPANDPWTQNATPNGGWQGQ
ncbi:single-stranded DNA-binding protein [Glutamicibacter soli]